jgi:outer membrane protein insertion porin family
LAGGAAWAQVALDAIAPGDTVVAPETPALAPGIPALAPEVPALAPGILAAPESLIAAGEPVVGWDYAGIHVLSALALDRAIGETARGRPLRRADLDRALAAVLAAYRDFGHLRAEVQDVAVRPVAGGVRLGLRIDEGPVALVGRVEIVGNELLSDADISAALGIRPGEAFSFAAFESGADEILERYENMGRPFAALEPRDLQWEEGVSFTLAVKEGQPVAVDGLRIEGNRVTKPAVVERLSGLRLGDPFQQRELERAQGRLERSGLFAQVEPLELVQGPDRTRNEVLIRVREGRANAISGAVGYGGKDIGWTGLFDLRLANLMGSGRQAHARWEGRGLGVERYELAYAEPWVFGSPVTAHIDLGRTIQDTLYTQSQIALAGEVPVLPELNFRAGWERESTVQSGSSLLGTARNALVLGGAWDSRNLLPYATRGLMLGGRVHLASKHLRYSEDSGGGGDDYRAIIIEAELERAQPLGRRWVAMVRGRGQGIRSQEEIIPYYELFPLGGASSLRGYREEQFRGAHVELVQLEQHFLIDSAGSRLLGFVDLGNVSTKGTVLQVPGEPESLFRIGYGAGLRFATRFGLAGLDYALGEGDGPLDGKLHVALQSSF